MSSSGSLAIAQVMAHCGGSTDAAMRFIAQAIAADPRDPARSAGAILAFAYFAYTEGDVDNAVMALGTVTGYRPDIAWANAPWFTDSRFHSAVSPAAFAEATMRIRDHQHDLDTDTVRECLTPWFTAIDAVCERTPDPDSMARMAILLRETGQTEKALALCDRADAIQPVMFTEVVRAATWRRLGNLPEAAASFHRALVLEPDNWSLYLDLADLAAEDGNYPEAAALAARGVELEPDDITMRAAAAAYRARSTGSPADRTLFDQLAAQVPEPYRHTLTNHVHPDETTGVDHGE
jgi:tetratricopeptide (TPR) repeat protein